MSYGFSFMPVLENWRAFLDGTVLTLELSLGATVVGLGVDVPSALAKVHGPWPTCRLVEAYVEAVRNTPFLVQIFFVFYVLPADKRGTLTLLPTQIKSQATRKRSILGLDYDRRGS